MLAARMAAAARAHTAGGVRGAAARAAAEATDARAATTATPPNLTPVPSSTLVAANVYISEGRRPGVLDGIVAAAAAAGAALPGALPWRSEGRPRPARAGPGRPTAALVHAFPDAAYNRTGLTFVGAVPSPDAAPASSLTAAVLAATRAALGAVDLRDVRGGGGGAHPTLGTVDHIAVHPLAVGAECATAAAVARAVAAGLGRAGVPAYLYGAAAARRDGGVDASPPPPPTLASVRRALGYFSPPASPGGAGGAPADPACLPPPDHGPAPGADAAGFARTGAASVGATPWVVNWNVPMRGGGSLTAATAAAIARAVSARGGGLAGVEALALPHEGGGDGGGGWAWEVATNLRDPAASPPAAVDAAVRAAAAKLGVDVEVGAGYCTGRDPKDVATLAAAACGWEVRW